MKLTRLAVAAATAVSMTLAGAGVTQAETTKEPTSTESATANESSSGGLSSEDDFAEADTSDEESGLSSKLSSTDAEADGGKEPDEAAEETDEIAQMSSQTIEENAGPFAPILLAIMPTLGGFFGVIDQIVGMLSLIAGPALNAQYSTK